MLGDGRRADREMLRQHLEVAQARIVAAGRQHCPAQPPAGHAEILGKAVHHRDFARQTERRRRLLSVRQALVDLVHHQHAAPLADKARDFFQLAGRNQRAGGIRGRAENQAARAAAPGRLHLRERGLEVRTGRQLERARAAFERAHHVAVGGIAGVRHQEFVARIDVQREREQQRAGAAGGHRDALRVDISGEGGAVVAGDRCAQFRQPQRRRVGAAPVAQRAHRGFGHLRRGGEIGLADLHVDHAAAGGFQLPGARQHVHHHERLDFSGAPGGANGGRGARHGLRGKRGLYGYNFRPIPRSAEEETRWTRS